MFVDVGRVDDGDPEYLTWEELETVQASGRWELQLHSGDGHQQIQYGPGPDDYGPYYAYTEEDEDFDGWQERVRSDIEWGQDTLADHVRGYRAARLRSSVRQLRPGRHQRPTHPRRPARLADRALRRRLHPGRERAGARGQRTAARPDPGHARRQRRRPPRRPAVRGRLAFLCRRPRGVRRLLPVAPALLLVWWDR